MTIWGYARCSTNETKQNIERQIRELKEMGCMDETIFIEWESGSNENRKELNKLLNIIQPFDTLVVVSCDRISRSTKQFISIIEFIEKQHIKLIVGKNFVVDCTTDKMDIMTEALLKVISVFSELERKMICARVKSGMANAKAKGSQIGRKVVDSVSDIPADFVKYYSLYKQGTINKSMLTDLAKVSYPTTLKYIKIIEGN